MKKVTFNPDVMGSPLEVPSGRVLQYRSVQHVQTDCGRVDRTTSEKWPVMWTTLHGAERRSDGVNLNSRPTGSANE